MPKIIPVGFGEATFQYTLTGDPDPFVNTLGFDMDTVTQADVSAISTAWANNVIPEISSAIRYVGCGFKFRQDANEDEEFFSTAGSRDGSRSGGMLPQNTTYLVKKRGPSSQRRNRGRMFLPGVAEMDVDNIGVVAANRVVIMQAGLNAFQAALVAILTFNNLVVFHNEVPATPAVITALLIDPTVATQRRRLRR